MTIRGKLFLSFGIMLVTVLVVATAALMTFLHWRDAAAELGRTRERSVNAERLQAAMIREVGLGIDYVGGEEVSGADFDNNNALIEQLFTPLQNARSDAEQDHIIGLKQTHDELNWVIDRIRRTATQSLGEEERDESRRRLREIADEVLGDIAALNQYYRNQVDLGFVAAASAANYATLTIAGAVLVAMAQLIALVILMQRWLVTPIAGLKQATTAISHGDLETRITAIQKDEWGELAVAVNEMARSLKALQEELATKERFAALGELGAYTAHNIRNPLAGIRAAIQVLHSEVPESNTDTRETMCEIIATVDRLDSWVKGFLEFARPLELKRAPADVNANVRNVIDIVIGRYSQNNVTIAANLTEPMMELNIDQVLIEQAIAALVTNACESGGTEVRIDSALAANGDGKALFTLTVADNGRGISDVMRNKLFRVFATDKRGGTGLGLAQAKKIVDLHGGRLELRESSAAGSTFVIALPITESTTDKSPSR